MAVVHSLHRESGTVRVDDSTCIRCGSCATICPTGVLAEEGGEIRVRPDSTFGCIACGHCMMVCPEGSVTVSGRGVSPDDLVELAPKTARADADALEALMRCRRSVRRFLDREVDPGLMDRILRMASSAPMGIPPWDVGCVAICGRAKVRDVSEKVVTGYEGMLKILRPWLIGLMGIFSKTLSEQMRSFILPLGRALVEAKRTGGDALFYGAPAVIIFHQSRYADPVDAAIACTYAMLAAESLGLGSTMIGAAPPVLKRNKPLCRELGIPEGNSPSIALILGYLAVEFHRGIRRHFSHVTRR